MAGRDFDAIPVIDLGHAQDDPTELLTACRNVGVFYVRISSIKAHIGDVNIFHKALREAELFFQQPQQDKERIR